MKNRQSRPWLRITFGLGIALGFAIQVVPYGHATVPVVERHEIHWNSPRTEELARRACYDCHSNETERTWFSRIAPISWLVQSNVDRGRAHLNFSEWDQVQSHLFDAPNAMISGEMPPSSYRLMHSEARLTIEEEEEFIDGIYATLGVRRVIRYEDLLGDRVESSAGPAGAAVSHGVRNARRERGRR